MAPHLRSTEAIDENRHSRKYRQRHVKPDEIFPGVVLWLPQRFKGDQPMYCSVHKSDDDCNAMDSLAKHSIRYGMYQHPIMILQIWQRPGSLVAGDLMVCFTDITSFDKTPLEVHTNRKDLIKFATSTPIRQTAPLPSDPFMVDLTPESEVLIDQSYIRWQHAWIIPANQLWTYRWRDSYGYSTRLTAQSYHLVANQIRIPSQLYEDTWTAIRTARQKLSWMVADEKKRLEAIADQRKWNVPPNWGATPSFMPSGSSPANQNLTYDFSTT